jgi:DNA polymerase-3 subunit epsilon
VEEWGIYDYQDRNGYIRFVVNVVARNTRPLITFTTKSDAWSFLWEQVRQHELCPKLSGLQTAKGPCFAHQSGTCRGACSEQETVKKYNKRAQQAIDSFFGEGDTVALVGRGRTLEEKSLVLVENGAYQGFGFFDRAEMVTDLESARNHITISKDNRVVQNLINSYLLNPRGVDVITLQNEG